MNDIPAGSENQRTEEWQNLDESGLQYHLSQWQNPKQSTKAFEDFLRTTLPDTLSVIDIGCGTGAATAYIAARNSEIAFTGLDYSKELVSIANEIASKRALRNLTFETADWFNLSPDKQADGVISLQSLSWLPEFERPLGQIFSKLKPQWIALTSLFYEGDITCRVEVEEHKRNNRRSFYNVYSLPSISRFCQLHNYHLTRFAPFKIDIDILKPNDIDFMSTYTLRVNEKSEDPQRIQISGPLLMNWYMILIELNT
jgi:trans-aconitate methyltransferase